MRKRFMQWWWDSPRPAFLRHRVPHIACLIWKHEQGRSRWCDWCGKLMRRR